MNINQNPHTNQSPLSVYFCGHECCEPNHSFGPAVRPHYLLHVVLSGKGIYQKDGITYRLKKGSAFLIPPMESTFYKADAENPWTYAWVGFDGKNCRDILTRTCFSNSFVYQVDDPTAEEALISHMKQLLTVFQDSAQNPLLPLGHLLLLFSCMKQPEESRGKDPTHQYLAKAQEYIEKNYTYHIRISDVADYVGIDRTYLYKIFMEKEGISPKEYLLKHRLRIAAQMLCSSQFTVTEIAFSCGFKDAPAFCNYFKKNIGYTPSQFRKLNL